MNIQWFPGHMAKTRREIAEDIKLVDIIYELTDARIPESGRNPEIDSLAGNKPRILLLNKCDMADDESNKNGLNIMKARELKLFLYLQIKAMA